jgi:hypothetical protein
MISCIVISVEEEDEVEDCGSIRSESNLQIDIGYSPDSTIYQYGRIESLERDMRYDVYRRVAHIIYAHTRKYTSYT